MKSYTDIEQSKKLAEILPIESADMYYSHEFVNSAGDYYKLNIASEGYFDNEESLGSDIPAWSLAALLDVLPYPSLHKTYRAWRCDTYDEEGDVQQIGEEADNPVDACVDMIEKLHELNLL